MTAAPTERAVVLAGVDDQDRVQYQPTCINHARPWSGHQTRDEQTATTDARQHDEQHHPTDGTTSAATTDDATLAEPTTDRLW